LVYRFADQNSEQRRINSSKLYNIYFIIEKKLVFGLVLIVLVSVSPVLSSLVAAAMGPGTLTIASGIVAI
jgi:hypothetical protein